MEIQSFSFGKNFTKPEVFTEKSLDYVKLGKDNKLPTELLNYYTNSSMNRAIIQKKTQMFKGKEISFESSKKSVDIKTENFINSVNPQEDLTQILEKIGLDLFIHGQSYLQIIWSKNGKNIVEIYHMAAHQMRSGKANDKGFIEEYYYNPSTEKYKQFNASTQTRDLIEFPAFNTKKYKNKAQILHIKKEEPTNQYYAYPDYISTLTDLDSDVEISNFHNSSIYNGFSPGLMVILNNIEQTPEEKVAFMDDINSNYKGSDNSNRVIVFHNDGGEVPTFEQLDVSDMDKRFDTLSKSLTERIVSGHQIPRVLASIAQPGSLGNSKEILQATQIFITQYIIPHQNLVLNILNKIMKINKLNEIEIINPNINIALYSLSELEGVLTTDEIREYLGYKPLVVETTDTIEEEEDVEITQGDDDTKNKINTDE